MSHSKEREEKICLNCNTELNGRFCHICGQENVEPKESVWHLVSHFFYDITHFDGKFFSTVKHLVRKPGFLPREYIRGRRASYLNPIRMYVFSSAIFFTIFFSLFSAKNWNLGDEIQLDENTVDSAMVLKKQEALQEAKTRDDSARIETYFAGIDNYIAYGNKDASSPGDSASYRFREKQEALKKAKTFYDTVKIEAYYGAMESNEKAREDTVEVRDKPIRERDKGFNIDFDGPLISRREYDSLQKTLPPGERDGWFKRLATYRSIELKKKYKHQPNEFFRDVADKLMHTFPYLLFISLPLYALFLKLLYIRRKQFYYVDHGIFLVYLYIFTFLVLLVFFSLNELDKVWDSNWIRLLEFVLILYGIVYTVKAMRNFYQQGRGRTILKFILLNIMAFISLIILFTLLFILTVFRV